MTSYSRLFLAGVVLALLSACGKKEHAHALPAQGHVHTAPHGGTLVEIGEHAYNLELLVDPTAGRLTAWVLDGHAENFVRIKAPALEVIAEVGAEKRALTLKAVANPATGETVGDTSQFEAQADWLKSTPRFSGVVPVIEIRGTKYRAVTVTVAPLTK